MKLIISILVLSTLLAFIVPNTESRHSQSPANSYEQQPPPQAGPAASVDRVQEDVVVSRANTQRTGAYNTTGVHSLTGYAWRTKKLFTLERKTPPFDENAQADERLEPRYHATSPLVANGLVYFTVYVGNGYLTAFDATTGDQKWAFQREHGAVSEPAIIGRTVYLGSEPRTIVALSTTSGRELWRFTAPPSSTPFKGLVLQIRGRAYAASPIVTEGLLLFGTMEGDFYAIDLQTHQLKWNIHPGGVLAPPTILNHTAYFTSSSGFLYAVDVNTGQEKWKTKVHARFTVAGNGSLYYSDGETVYALDASNGQQKWKAKMHGKIGTGLAVASGTIYFGGHDDSIYAIDAETGQDKWRFRTRDACDSPVIADGVVYAGSFEQFFAINAKSGQQVWVLNEKQTSLSSPAIADGVLYAVAEAGYLCAIR
jgi:outer membrane protein assembly factor BamB